MNLDRYEDFTFTDNLCQSYANYQAGAVDAKQQTQYLKNRLVQYMNKVNELRTSYHKQNSDVIGVVAPQLSNFREAFILYFESHNINKNLDFDGGNFMKISRTLDFTEEKLIELLGKIDLKHANEAYEIINHIAYVQVPFYGDIKPEWDVRIRKTFLNQIPNFTESEFEALLYYLTLIARGILFLHKQIGNNPKHQNWAIDQSIAFCVIFAEALSDERYIVSTIMPERIPVCDPNSENLSHFNYRQYIILNDACDLNFLKYNRKIYYDTHKVNIRNDPDKFECFKYMNVNFRRDAPLNELQIAVQYKHIFSGDIQSYYIRPLKIFKWMVKEPTVTSFLFDPKTRRWVFNASYTKEQVVSKSVQVEQQVMQQMDNSKHTKKLVEILDMMPTLNIKLSQLQKNVVASNQNLLCLGRSGTGKTTTSVLRLFAQEILYAILKKHNENQNKKRQEKERQNFLDQQRKELGVLDKQEQDDDQQNAKPKQKQPVIESTDLEQNSGMKMVFITASPVLTTEVRRFYSSIKAKLVIHLRKKENARLEAQIKGVEFQEINEEEAIEIIDEAVEEEESKLQQIEGGKKTIDDHEMQEMLEFIKKEEKDLMDDLHIESHLQIPNSYDDLQSHHFPLFATVKKLIYMLDACLNYSFFSRDHNNNIIGLESNLGWHNESKGVMMINHYYKENIDYDEQIAKFGKELLEMDKQAEIDDDFVDDSDTRNFVMYANDQKQQQQKTAPGPSSAKYVGQWHNRAQEKYHLERQQLSFEVDYDTFEQKFWPKIGTRKNMKKISPSLVWTEIYSTIKGGMRSCQYYMGYLPRQVYIKDEGSDFLYYNEKKAIYYIFLEYEKWKAEQRAYDFMDVVNHIQKRLWYGETMKRMKMDYLMVDEVQDLTPKTLQVLLKLTTHNVFFAGDTAQTIAKGVGARFLDLRHLFSEMEFGVPKIVQLTKNYRSHGKILDLANSVVSLIELFFPRTIDKLVKEESDKDGMKPLVIMPLDGRMMKSLFTGTTMTNENKDSSVAAPQFGCNQVLIVRDQEAKEMVPEIFRNMLCLSVYEAKGLEFDDVILYNFFHLGDIAKSEWKLLNDIVYQEVKRLKYKQEILDFDCLDVENFEEIMRKIKELEKNEDEQEFEDDLQLSVSRHRDEVYRKFSMLCIELKFLYVAITRPKRRLIIYDDVADGRKPIQAYWEKLGVIDVVTKDMIAQPEQLDDNVKAIFMSGALHKERSSQDEWRIQGIKLFKKKYYEAAIKCFQNSNDDDLVKRCMAYQEADLGQSRMGESDNKIWRSKVLKHLTKIDKKKLIKEAKKDQLIAKRHFKSAGQLFEAIQMLKHAASCFFTAKDYDKAAQIFEQLGSYGQAAECYMEINELKKAAKLYEKANIITKSIECYEASGEWEQLLHCLHRNKDFFKQEERQSLINKYVPVALNSLYKLYSQEDEENELDEENKGKLQEMKIKLKYQKKVDVIAEEDEDIDEEDDEETIDDNDNAQDIEDNDQDAQANQDKQEAKVSPRSDKEDEIDIIEEEDEVPDILNDIFQLKQRQASMKEEEEQKQLQQQQESQETKQKNDNGDESFEIIDTATVQQNDQENKTQDKEEDGALMVDDFEHLSQYDPDDEFLRSSKSVSIIESILSKKSISQTSDFSIISTAQGKKVNSIISMSSHKSKNTIAFVESNRDIYAEDVITQKIIYYVSLFSDDVSAHLKNIRSKKMLHSNNPSEQAKKNEEIKEDDFMIDLDDVDSDFVNLILDVLEYYELFRLCLMICNRYHMSERLGRYIVSVCSKYSNIHNHRFNLSLYKQNHINKLWKEKQRFASIIAHEAIHNVFTLIEPKFLSLKDVNDQITKENSLGIETYRMMMDLGFWKKLVYIHNGYTGLQICYTFFDKTNFDILMETLDVTNKQGPKYEQIQLWNSQIIYREFLTKIQKEVAYQQLRANEQQGINDLLEEYEDSEQLKQLSQVYKWLYIPQKTFGDYQIKNQKLSAEQKEKIDEKIQKNLDTRMNEIYEIYDEKIFKNPQSNFEKYLFAYQLLLIPGTTNYSRVLDNVRQYFDSNGVQQMIKLLSQAIDVLNLEKSSISQNIIIDALYSTFLLSSLDNNINEDDQDIYKSYKNNFMIMNVNSALMKDVLQIKQAMDAVQTNEFIGQKLVELRPKYFMVNNFRSAFIKHFKDFQNQFHQKHAFFFEKSETAFILDMDSDYIMVPKTWITKLLIIKLLNVCLSLANEMRGILHYEFDETKTTKEEHVQASQLKELQIFSKLNMQTIQSYQIHNTFAQNIENQQQKLFKNLSRKEEYKSLLNQYWQKFSLSCIRFSHLEHQSSREKNIHFRFINSGNMLSLGIGINKIKLTDGKGQIIEQGINLFKIILNQRDLSTFNKQQQEIINEDILQMRFKQLQEAFSYFIFIDEYEIFVEILKSHIKSLNENTSTAMKKIQWMLKKFMIAVDIHVFLKYNSLSNAASSILLFMNTFEEILTVDDQLKLLEQAFYLVQIGKFGNVFCPDYMIKLLDRKFDAFKQYDQNQINRFIEQQEYFSYENFVLEEEERPPFKRVLQGKQIEKISKERVYFDTLKAINKMIQNLNQDELSGAYRQQFISLFNMLMSALVNDPKKSSDTYDYLSEGFNLIEDSPVGDYFNHNGLLEFEYNNSKGLNDLYKQFKETEEEFKYQFFCPSAQGGHFLAHIDVRPSQSEQIQAQINKELNSSFFKEAKTMASHLYLAMKLKRLFKQKRNHFYRLKKLKSYSYEDRVFSQQMALQQLLTIDQLPGMQVVNLIKEIMKKQIMLKQMIVSKHATNSLDIHYILAKSNELQQINDDFYAFVIKFINEKGQILSEFEDLQNENSIDDKLAEIRKQFQEINYEINQWMNQKAEPNMIEVERKNTKYKMKWESLKIFEKKQRLIAVMRMQQQILQNQ